MKANKQITVLAVLACLTHATLFADETKTTPPASEPATQTLAKTPATEPAPPPAGPVVTSDTDKGLRFNFRGAPLEMVLNYLSEAAGFIIVLDSGVSGKVDLWSNQPLTKPEAVTLLNTVLEKNGLAAIRNDRTLTIMKRDDAKKRDLPVKSGSNPESIPKSNDMVTQILPVGALNVVQLAKDLQTIVPAATLTANESGNALVITDTQTNIRRIAEIIKALDGSTASMIRVFQLKYADSKAVATMLKELFPSQNTSSSSGGGGDPRSFFRRMTGEDRGGDQSSGSKGRSATHVTAVADENSNSVVVSASEDLMSTIEDLINQVDTSGDSAAELRVFRLKFADPQEMADLLTSLFPDASQSSDNSDNNGRSMGFRFGGFPFGGGESSRGGGGGRSSNNSSSESERMKKKSRVAAVADRRTASVVVTADKDLMTQIAAMVEQLDANPAKKQKVFVYSLENADPQEVQTILQGLFQDDTRRSTTTGTQNNPLTTRNNTSGNGTGSATGFGQNSGFGNTGR